MPIHFEKAKLQKVARWVLLFGIWLLILNLLGKATQYAYDQAFLELGPEKIVGTQNVIYEEAPGYLYTNPMAMIHLHLKILFRQGCLCLLSTVIATGVFMAYKAFSGRKTLSRILQVFFWIAMALLLLYLAIICVWEWFLAWLVLLFCVSFMSQWTFKSKLTAMTLIAAIAILGWQRMNLKDASRRYDAFWNMTEKCATRTDFEQNFGTPVFCRHVSLEDKEWFCSLANLGPSLWFPDKTLAGFISPQMPDILLLPWFDDDGRRIAFAWCDFTPERKEFLSNKEQLQIKNE